MTTPQVPIGSGFGAASTGAEVIAGCDLAGQVAVVTGGYSGIGLIVRSLTAWAAFTARTATSLRRFLLTTVRKCAACAREQLILSRRDDCGS